MSTYNCPNCGVILHRCSEDKTTVSDPIILGRFVLDYDGHQITFEERVLNLSNKEFDLLVWFMKESHRVIPREETIERIWGADYLDLDIRHSLDVYIRRLRRRTSKDCILTVRGYGHKFVP